MNESSVNLKKRNIFVATDVFPEEPVPKKSSLRKVKNILLSAHRAGALKSAFFNTNFTNYFAISLIDCIMDFQKI